jgi:gelsolin
LDDKGTITFEAVTPIKSSLITDDAFLLDDSAGLASPAIYVWLGKQASQVERRIAIQHGQHYLHKMHEGTEHVFVNLVKINEGEENEAFWKAFGA